MLKCFKMVYGMCQQTMQRLKTSLLTNTDAPTKICSLRQENQQLCFRFQGEKNTEMAAAFV